jgi:hypothetical protein
MVEDGHYYGRFETWFPRKQAKKAICYNSISNCYSTAIDVGQTGEKSEF